MSLLSVFYYSKGEHPILDGLPHTKQAQNKKKTSFQLNNWLITQIISHQSYSGISKRSPHYHHMLMK